MQENFCEKETFSREHTEDRVKPFMDSNSFERNHNFYFFDDTNQKQHFAPQQLIVDFIFQKTGAVDVMQYIAFALV